MKINSINNINFTKRPVATCLVKNKENEKHNAVIYEYKPTDKEDLAEILNSDSTYSIKSDFYKASFNSVPKNKYYAVLDTEADKITSCAKTGRHLADWDENSEFYTSIEEIEGNKDYVDSLTPLIGFLACLEKLSNSSKIISSFRTDGNVDLKKYSFSKTKNGTWMLPSQRFEPVIQRAEKRNNLELLV